jgi:small multidrug resistance pump
MPKMSAYELLALAIGFEIAATLGLRASHGLDRIWVLVFVAIGYVCSFTMLGLAMRAGLNLNIGYAIWSAMGTAVIAVLSWLLFGETLSVKAGFGVLLVLVGVVLIHVGDDHGTHAADPAVHTHSSTNGVTDAEHP